MSYRTNSGPKSGAILWTPPVSSIGVYEDASTRLVGVANPVAGDEAGRTVYRLTVRGTPLSGRWVVVDRRFVEAAADG